MKTSRSVFGVGMDVANYVENVDKMLVNFEKDDRNFLNNNYERHQFPPFSNYDQKLEFLITHQTNVMNGLETARAELELMLHSPHCK
jgi:hypothetical protein